MSLGILLGVPDAVVDFETSWDVNKIGGNPDGMVSLPRVQCSRCRKAMTHVVQVYCPLELSPFHRVLHVFACTTKSCWNSPQSWRVFRSQQRDSCHDDIQSKSVSKEKKVAMETSDWCDDADDWGSDEDVSDLVAMVTDSKPSTSDNLVAESQSEIMESKSETEIMESKSETQDSQSTGTNEESSGSGAKDAENSLVAELKELEVSENSKVSGEDDFLHPNKEAVDNAMSYLATKSSDENEAMGGDSSSGPLKSFYLNVFDEPANDESDSRHVTSLMKEYERRERVDLNSLMDNSEMSGGKKGQTEKYEKTEIKHGDKHFHKFMKRLKVCPEQVVRYQYGGQPLLLCQPQGDLSPAPCSICHAPRVFEMQLVPPLIPYLKYSGSSDPAVEFGTVMVYTCSMSCWQEDSPQPREEFVLVQADPDQHLFKL